MFNRYHVAFEPIWNLENRVRIIIFDIDDDTGAKSVRDIIELDTDKPMDRKTRGNLDEFTNCIWSSEYVTYAAYWPASLKRLRSDASRIRRIIENYPGPEACKEMKDIPYNLPKAA